MSKKGQRKGSPDEEFWISDARRELVLAVRRSDVWPVEIKGPMIEIIRKQLDAMSHSLGNLELVFLRGKQGYGPLESLGHPDRIKATEKGGT